MRDIRELCGNALEASRRCPKDEQRFISLASDFVGENLVIKIRNSYNGFIQSSETGLKSIKGERQGIGLSNVRQVVNKYKGNMEIFYAENVFEICIVI